MKSLLVASQKGGVGKTTLALNLAYSLARSGWRVLLADCDPHGSLGLSIRRRSSGGPGLAELAGRAVAVTPLATRIPGLSLLLAGDSETLGSEAMRARLSDPELWRLLLATASCDVLIVDTPSGFYGPTLAAAAVADHLLVPLQAEPLALRTTTQVLDAVARLRDAGAQLTLSGFVLSMLESRNQVSLSVAQESWRTFPLDLVWRTTLPRDSAVLQASAQGVPIGLLARRPPPMAKIFEQLAAEAEERLGLVTGEQHVEPIALVD
ncbi:MAG TPA: ParA family protein [Thermoanaerobaculia bacterium]|jgi:chromosome partitioning protein|nr:ParA family protein [Thermoanaerobaculia bacterium]